MLWLSRLFHRYTLYVATQRQGFLLQAREGTSHCLGVSTYRVAIMTLGKPDKGILGRYSTPTPSWVFPAFQPWVLEFVIRVRVPTPD